MRRLRFCLALLLVAGSAFAQAKGKAKPKPGDKPAAGEKQSGRIKLTVVDVAGGRAYVEPGAGAGLRAGDTAEFSGRKYSVVAVSPKNAVLELGKLPLALGSTGLAVIDPERAPAKIEPLPTPAPLAAYQTVWPRSVVPAATQTPRSIPLGPIFREERSRVQLSLAGYGVIPTSGDEPAWGQGELRGVLHYEPFSELPFALDADVAAQAWAGGDFSARAGSDSRPLARVRMLQAAYGSDAAFLAALGRLRYASSTLGTLDGVKLRAPIAGGLSLGAFGGFVADPLSGAPSGQASRFGGELAWEDARAAWRPRAVLGGHASRFDGALDERRMNLLFDLNPEVGRFGGHAEVSFFDQDNPWEAAPVELTAAGADVAFRVGALDVGGRVAMQRPERSRYLASFLPPEWLCLGRVTGATPEPCIGNDATYMAGLDAGLGLEDLRLSAGVTGSRTEHIELEQLAGYGNIRFLELAGSMRLDTGVSGSSGTLLDTAALSISPGVPFMNGDGDASLRYRPALLRYRASTKAVVEHTVGGALSLSPSGSLDLTLDADFVTGGGFDAFIVQSAAVWRTGF
ncbi:MAG: hypothetical protein IPM35_34450 [Myxococcales bacterium]|nr:hypothetical protein [Myxococcales bacterium]